MREHITTAVTRVPDVVPIPADVKAQVRKRRYGSGLMTIKRPMNQKVMNYLLHTNGLKVISPHCPFLLFVTSLSKKPLMLQNQIFFRRNKASWCCLHGRDEWREESSRNASNRRDSNAGRRALDDWRPRRKPRSPIGHPQGTCNWIRILKKLERQDSTRKSIQGFLRSLF